MAFSIAARAAGSGPNAHHPANVSAAMISTPRDEIGRHFVGEALGGGAGALRPLHQPDDLGDGRRAAHFRRLDADGARCVHGASEHGVAGALLDRNALAGEH